MGHIVNADRSYRLLRRQLDRTVTGAPDSPVLMKILRLLFSPQDAELARRIPHRPTPLGKLSAKLGIARDELREKMRELARRGLVFDLEHNGRQYFALAPIAIGFFEMTFMRVRDDVPVSELARLFDEYMHADDRFARSVFQRQTQLGRSLVHEEALPEDDHTEILDWERASEIVRSASPIAVSLCACRHKASHLGKACDRPQRVCLSLNYAAGLVLRSGMAEQITTGQALQILEECKAAGLAQTADNVRRKVAYICNCCGCCCEMMQAIRRFDIRSAIVSSNWIVQVDTDRCKGCGRCAEACPVGAIQTAPADDGEKPGRLAVADEALCLGCGVCYSACRFGAISMKPRQKRVFTPETVFDRIAAMAIERGKLADLIFEDPERLTHRALDRIVKVIEKSPLFKAAMAIRPLKSAFLSRVVAEAKRRTGQLSEVLE